LYQIIAYDSPTDKTGHVVFDPRVNCYISDGKLNLKESEIDDLSLTVNQANYLFGNVRPLQTHIETYQDNSLLFRGRALDLTREMKDSGQFVQSFVFESIQNYLQDTSQRWAKVQNTTPKQFFQRLIDTHNLQVPDYKKFTIRNVDVTNSTDNVYRYIEDGATTWDTIKDKLVSRLGGFIRVEYVNGVNYIDYLQSPGKEHPNDTPIRIGKNLQSASVQIDPTEVITQLVPLGATIENNSTTTDTQVSQPRIDIKSVNNGKDYLDIPELQKEFGIIRKSVQWDDVHEPKILLTKAKQWIAQQTAAKESWTVNALELPKLESFKVSDRYLFNNQAVASPQMLRVTSKAIDLLHWQKSTLTIAEKASSLSNYQLENKRSMELQKAQTREAKAQAKRAYDSRLTGVLVDNIVPVGSQDDSESKEETVPLFELQVAGNNPDFNLKKGQKFAVKTTARGVDGLDKEIESKMIRYELATTEQPGLMSAADKEKLDVLQQYTEATEEQAGLMPAEDKAKLNKLKEEPVESVRIKDAMTGSIYLLTVENGEIKLEEGADNSDGSER